MSGTKAEDLSHRVQVHQLSVVARLRDTADAIAAREVRPDLHDLAPDHAELAARIIHDVQGMVGNLRLDQLVAAAADADRAAREVRP